MNLDEVLEEMGITEEMIRESYTIVPVKVDNGVWEFYCMGELVRRYVNCYNVTENFMKDLARSVQQECLEGFDFYEKDEDGDYIYFDFIFEGIWNQQKDCRNSDWEIEW